MHDLCRRHISGFDFFTASKLITGAGIRSCCATPFLQHLLMDAWNQQRPQSQTVLLLARCLWLLWPLCKFSGAVTANGMHSVPMFDGIKQLLKGFFKTKKKQGRDDWEGIGCWAETEEGARLSSPFTGAFSVFHADTGANLKAVKHIKLALRSDVPPWPSW